MAIGCTLSSVFCITQDGDDLVETNVSKNISSPWILLAGREVKQYFIAVESCGIMCYYVMSRNYCISCLLLFLRSILYVQFSLSSVGLELYPPVDCSLNNNILPRYKC